MSARTAAPGLWHALLGSRWLPLCIILLGALLRIAMTIVLTPGTVVAGPGSGEADNVARAIAAGRGFADPYFVGSGPTAHLMPTTPLFAGGVLAVFGPNSRIASAILTGVALIEVSAAYLLLYMVGARLGMSRPARLLALAWLCFVPTFFKAEAGAFQFWDGGLALALGLGALYHCLSLYQKPALTWRDDAIGALLATVTFFVSPIVGLGVIACYAVLSVMRRGLGDSIKAFSVLAVCLAIVFSPWTIRNYENFGRFIPTRDNAGLELAIANYDGAADDRSFPQSYWNRLHDVHPLQDGPGRAALVKMGEVAYFDRLMRDTKHWIAAHPTTFAYIYARHVREMIFPPEWTLGNGAAGVRILLLWLTNTLGLLAIAWGIASGQRQWIFPGLIVLILALGYGPFQPVQRYYYPICILLTLGAADFGMRLIDGPARAVMARYRHNAAAA